MSTALLIVAAAVALGCPVHMVWRARRGERADCMPAHAGTDLDAVRDRQRALGERIARSEREQALGAARRDTG